MSYPEKLLSPHPLQSYNFIIQNEIAGGILFQQPLSGIKKVPPQWKHLSLFIWAVYYFSAFLAAFSLNLYINGVATNIDE